MLDDIPLPQILVANEEVIVSADDGMTLDNFLVSAVEEESGCKVNILMLQSSWTCTILTRKCTPLCQSQLSFKVELWWAERCTFSCQNRTRSRILTVLGNDYHTLFRLENWLLYVWENRRVGRGGRPTMRLLFSKPDKEWCLTKVEHWWSGQGQCPSRKWGDRGQMSN